MNTLRSKNPVKYSSKDDIVFQCFEWIGTNELKTSLSSDPKKKYNKSYQHVVKLYGVTKEGYSVSVNNNEFKPYFFIKVASSFTELYKVKLTNAIKLELDKDAKKKRQFNSYSKDIISLDIVKRKDFYGFNNNKLFKFIKITFQNTMAMNKTNQIVKDGVILKSVNCNQPIKFKIYESNISPFIRFIHTKELKAAGWVKIPSNKYTINRFQDKTSQCQIDIDINFNDIQPIENNAIAPLLIASFDIECSSSHGDFPLAKKNYKKLGCEIYDNYTKYRNTDTFTNEHLIDYIELLYKFAFTHSPKLNIDDISYVFTQDEDKPSDKIIKKISRETHSILHTDENYKLLGLEILKYFFMSDKNNIHGFQKEYKQWIIDIITDSFSDFDIRKNNKKLYEKKDILVKTIYTKTNKKPAKRIIENVAVKALKQIYLLFKKIKKLFPSDEYDINNETINDFIDIYLSNYNANNETKIKIINDEFEFDNDTKYSQNIINDIGLCINMLFSYFNEELPEIDDGRDTYCKRIIEILDLNFPAVDGDKVIQIGTTIQRYGEPECFLKHIITLNTCSPIPGAVVEAYQTEKEVLLAWTRFIQNLDPDIVTGYNIFGFDFAFMWDRAEELDKYYTDENILSKFSKLGRIRYTNKDNENIIKNSKMEVKKLASSALGDNTLKYITMEGRIILDLFKVVQKDFNLVSYKLDYVAETFINDKILEINDNVIKINGIKTLNEGNFITINYGFDKKYKDKKFKIIDIDFEHNTIKLNESIESSIMSMKPKWTMAKDDVSPQDIFRLQEGNADDRCIVATYCIQDCALCNNLIDKLKIITNNIGMANVCSVPLSYLFLRGQGVKIFSLVSQQCRKEGFLIPVIKYEKEEIRITDTFARINDNKYDDNAIMFEYGEDDEAEVVEGDGGYEGAIVLKPKPGIYLDTPVVVLDYASLYPSSMISENLSHDSIILEDDKASQKYLGDSGIEELKKIGYGYEDIQHDVYKWIDPAIKSKGKKKTGVKTCRFVQPLDGSKSVIPNKLRELLKARKNTRKLIKFKTLEFNVDGKESKSGLLDEKDGIYTLTQVNGASESFDKELVKSIKDTYNEFEKSVFDGLQLAFKMTANSLYGQLGASTSQIFLKDIAASTTATGRKLLYLAKDKVEEHFDGAEVVYGDSIPSWELLKLQINNELVIDTVKNIKETYFKWNNDDKSSKQYYLPYPKYNINTFTDKGLTPVISLMEHKSNNDIIKIITTSGDVHVTNEHSLILDNGTIITPIELKIGDKLMTISKLITDGKVLEIINLGSTNEYVYDLTTENHHFQAGNGNIVVHNTDSIFINFNPKNEDGKSLKNKPSLIKSIEMGVQAEKYIQPFLKAPHKLEYEKTFWPFILFSKKRYIGNKYEFKTGENDYKQTSMGIVLKRRDNADIVKHVYGGVIDILMNQKNLELSIQFLKTELFKLLDGKFGMDMLVVTKSLRGYYKNPQSIAHKVLADRMGVRDPGNKPSSNDRIPYVYIQVKEIKNVNVLQGDRIEHPDFIKENNLKPDYKFYITNQIMKPVGQIYSLIVEKLDGFKYAEDYYDTKYKSLLNTLEPKKARNKINDLRFKDGCDIVFGEVLRVAENRKNRAREITDFFKQTF